MVASDEKYDPDPPLEMGLTPSFGKDAIDEVNTFKSVLREMFCKNNGKYGSFPPGTWPHAEPAEDGKYKIQIIYYPKIGGSSEWAHNVYDHRAELWEAVVKRLHTERERHVISGR